MVLQRAMDATQLPQQIAADIEKSGFPLEVTTGLAFTKGSWTVVHQMVYRDLEENKSRAIDVLAIKNLTPTSGPFKQLLVWALIECKKSDNPWVFYGPTTDSLQDKKRTISNYLKVASNPPVDIKQGTLFQNSHYVTREPLDRLGQAHYMAFIDPKSKSHGVDQIWTALNQASKAVYFFQTEITNDVSRKESSGELHVFYPIIVVDGPIFLYSLDQNRRTQVTETQYVKFNHDVLTPKSDLELFLIDIVAKTFLPTYIQWLSVEANSMAGLRPVSSS